MSDSDALRKALAPVAAADAAGIVEEARAGARARARRLIEEALVDEIVRAAAAVDAARAEPSRTGDAWWAYCVIDARDGAALPDGIAAVEAATQVELVTEGDLTALVSAVPRPDYDDEQLREHLNDIAWVERTARAHEQVIDQALTRAAVVPLRLCTIYHDVDHVRRMLRDEREGLRRSLEMVAGKAEWGLKLFADPERLRAALAPDGTDEDYEPRAGREYLARKQRAQAQQAAADDFAARCAEDAHRRLSAIAEAARVNPLQAPEAHGRSARMVLNGVYLVPFERDGELMGAVEILREEWEPAGFELELTGPWPAYNFIGAGAPVTP